MVPARSPQNAGGIPQTASLSKPQNPNSSVSKNRLITEFLPLINSVPALRDNLTHHQPQLFDRESGRSSVPVQNDKVSALLASNILKS
jgi:hypothetical protein